jgi:hypothetical protein
MFDDFNFLFESQRSQLKKKKIKNVTFSNYIYIYLIPMYTEFKNYQDLWWSEDEITNIKQNTVKEIQQLMNSNPSMEISHAKKLLFQPNNICYDPQNFADCE